jgi:sodium transport system permease protein
MSNVWTVFKKEFYRVISDKRLVFTTIFLPGLAIFLMYSIIGEAIGNEIEDIESHVIIVYEENMPDSITQALENTGRIFEYREYDDSLEEKVKEELLAGEADLLISFPENFEELLLDYTVSSIPDIKTSYNPGERYSENAYSVVLNALNSYQQVVLYERFGTDVIVFTMDQDNPNHIIMDEDKALGQGFASLLPMLIVLFLFSGAMSIGPDAIAGEKERGTIATLLVTPIKRSDLALGKILGLSVISLFSAASSLVGILLSLPKLMQGTSLDAGIYGPVEYMQIVIVLISTVLVIVGMIAMLSTIARSVKEASMLVLPLYFLSIVISVSTMFSGEGASNALYYIIPIYSSVNILISILTFEVVPFHIALMVLSSLLYVGLLVVFTTKLFESERIIFAK